MIPTPELYFCIVKNPWHDRHTPGSRPKLFLVCGKDHWDKEKCLDDELEWVEDGFTQLAEGHYAYQGDVKEGKAKLIKLGHVENLDMGRLY